MTAPEVLVERDGAVAHLVLAAPARRNALTEAMAAELHAACEALDADDGVGAVVVRGAEGRFCAGADRRLLDHVGEDPAEEGRFAGLSAVYGAFARVGDLRAPTIAAVRGAAVGAGLNLALVCDLRVVAHDARLVAGFLRIGLHPGGGSLTLLGRLAGAEAAAAVALFGEELDGRRARELGLAWEAVPDAEVEGRATTLARVAAQDPALARMAIATLRAERDAHLTLRQAVEFERAAQMWSLRRRP